MRRFLLSALLVLFGGRLAHGQTASNASPADQIRRAALDQIVRQYSLAESRIDVRIDQLDADLTADRRVRLAFSDAWETPRGRVQADILSSRTGERWTKHGWALLYVSHYDSVVVSRKTLRPDKELDPRDVKIVRADVTKIRNQPLTSAQFREQCSDEQCFVRQYIREGEVIRRDAVRHRYAAAAGDMVEMRYQRHGIRANLRCRTRQSGFVGDVVRISCPSTGSIYRVRLTGEGVAEWRQTL